MKYAADFRAQARQALKGNWFIAVITGLIATLLGGAVSSGPSFSLNASISGGLSLRAGGFPLFFFSPAELLELMALLIPILFIALALGLPYMALGSVIQAGYAQFNLNLVDGREAQPADLFAHFSNFKTLFCARLLVMLYTFLWSLLLFIPGIIASYSYAMVPYLLAEYPDMTASEAITYSKELMRGSRWRLFCLHFSFIGWAFLCAFTFGFGILWLHPYEAAAEAAFYRDLVTEAAETTESASW